ncbi:MAG: hypothetical protein JWM76_4271 [Pseudonocardiales bacterium]|nr:hypothetical protein [Pseudonocardiales bacterium]
MVDRGRQIQDESDRFGAVLAGCDSMRGVPTCPEWTAVDLLSHLVTVQRFWAVVIGDRLTGAAVADYERSRPPLPEDPTTLQALRGQATTDLLTALGSRDASEPAWSWFTGDQTVGFTWRMQTHEATMHRVDAELTAGLPISPIATEVAEDGVDHVVDVMWAWAPPDAERRYTGIVELAATDSARRWLVRTFRWSAQAWGQDFTDQIGCEPVDRGEPDATVCGTTQDLDLLVWSRADRKITRSGNEMVLGEWQAMLNDGIR